MAPMELKPHIATNPLVELDHEVVTSKVAQGLSRAFEALHVFRKISEHANEHLFRASTAARAFPQGVFSPEQ